MTAEDLANQALLVLADREAWDGRGPSGPGYSPEDLGTSFVGLAIANQRGWVRYVNPTRHVHGDNVVCYRITPWGRKRAAELRQP